MSIEFRCRKCNKKLRVADSAAGKQGACPGCGETFITPAPGAEPPRQGTTRSSPPPVPLGVSAAVPPPPPPPLPLDSSGVLSVNSPANSNRSSKSAIIGKGHHGRARKTPTGLIITGAVVAFAAGIGLAYFGWQWYSSTQRPGVALAGGASTGRQNAAATQPLSATAAASSTKPAPNNGTSELPAEGQTPDKPNSVESSTAAPSTEPTSSPDPAPPAPNTNDPEKPSTPETPTPSGPNPNQQGADAGVPGTPGRSPNGTDPPKPPMGNGGSDPTADPKTTPKNPKPEKKPSSTPKTPNKAPKGGKASDEPEHAFGPDGVCLVCQGRAFAPLAKQPTYVHMEGDPPPKPEACVPWRFCPHCQKDHAEQELIDAEAQRLLTAPDKHKEWEQKTQVQFVRVETRHATLHVALPADVARRQGTVLEQLVSHLQTLTKSTLLTQTRPNTLDMLILPNTAAYEKFLTAAPNLPEFSGVTDWELMKKTSGWSGGRGGLDLTIQNASSVPNLPPEHMTISLFARRNIGRATGEKGRDWFHTGFPYYCEKAITNQNRVHSIHYQIGEPVLSQDWNADIKKFAQQGKLRAIEDMFSLELRFFTAADHLECYSLVSFLIKTEPKKFIKLVQVIAQDQDDKTALESIYEKPLKDLQTAWGKWAAAQ